MLKSTYKPSGNVSPPLPPGWTEHKAPTGHTYYYNADTKESTYKRPGVPENTPAVPPPAPVVETQDPRASYRQYSSVGSLADPAAANAFLAQYNPQHQQQRRQDGGRGVHQQHGGDRPRPQPHDKPRSKLAIPGFEPWVLVYTKYGRRFAYNPEKNTSYWRIPAKIMKGVIELDIQGAKEKADKAAAAERGEGENTTEEQAQDDVVPEASTAAEQDEIEEEEEVEVELGSDYEEVEVTDDEGEEGDEHPSKRQRTEEPAEEDLPQEFNEDDIAFQLQAMGEEYGLDPGEYDDGHPEDWPEGAEGMQLSDEDARALFEDLLTDLGINPYSPWDKLLEDGKIIDDPRYTILPTTKARRDVWEAWSRAKIAELRERRAREEQRDPRIAYLAFLQAKASPRLYWPEFKRKHRREPALRDTTGGLTDRDREKLYREHVARLKLPVDTRKKDLTALLRAVPACLLHARTVLPDGLPAQVLADVRYASLDPEMRDPLVAAYVATLPLPPEDGEAAEDEEDEATRKRREDRRKREKALADRERVVAEQKRRQARDLEYGRAALREEERELERAMRVDKRGLQSQLLAEREKGVLVEGAAPGTTTGPGASNASEDKE
jgi:hypothetical protein